MPISCFLGQVGDSVADILGHHMETGFLASYGGGVAGDWSLLRSEGVHTSRGNKTQGVVPFINMMDTQMMAMQQGATRRGAYAAYMDVSHPEIEEFIELRDPHGSDLNRRCLGKGFHHAVNIPDAFMVAVERGDNWDLIDPHTKEVRKQVKARELWMKILITRLEFGEPYILFIDTANKALPAHLKRRGLRINNSNLCSEIMLPTAPNRTAVCCLSSVNLEHFDLWRANSLFIRDIVEMLDNVLEFFINNAPKAMSSAVSSAFQERSIGLGAMGFHLLLQKKLIPFESPMASGLNRGIFKLIKEYAEEANYALGKERGEAPDAVGTGKRFSHLMAIAPNASISSICGNTSPSVEPFNSNGYKWSTLSGSFLIKNKELDRILKLEYGLVGEKYDDVWSSIITNKGSVQHLDFLSNLHKDVFKTSFELDQNWIIEHAGVRQEYICQGQSVNVFLKPDIHKNDLHKLHFSAWKKGLKALYYCRSQPIKPTENITTTNTVPTLDAVTIEQDLTFDDKGCLSCEG